MLELSIDLEALSVSRDQLPAMIEIGVVAFDRSRPADDCVVASFQRAIPFATATNCGSVDSDTLAFWEERGIKGGNDCLPGEKSGPLISLVQLSGFLELTLGRPMPELLNDKSIRWWAWGAEYDLRIIQGLSERVGLPMPIPYRGVRDARTYCTELADQFGIVLPKQDPATKHNALDDARHCARLVTGVTQSMEVIREMAESREVVA